MESITIKDIAKMCGVGVSTVSRAINNHPDINEETKNKIMAIIREYNFVPNNNARNLKRTETRTIAVLVKGITNPFFSTMIKYMEALIEKKKYSLVLHHVEGKEDEVDVALELVKEKKLQGIIFLGGFFTHTEEKLLKLKVPFVISTIGMVDSVDKKLYSSVSIDDFKESFKIVDYLCECGHKDIAIITADEEDKSIGSLRKEGYRQALLKHHIPVRNEYMLPMSKQTEEYSMENGYIVMKDFLKKGFACTAVFAITDLLAIGACRAIKEAGYVVPEDISVAGFDGIEATRYYSPTITTIHQPVKEMAEESVRILFDVISSKAMHQHEIFNGTLVVGESTKIRNVPSDDVK